MVEQNITFHMREKDTYPEEQEQTILFLEEVHSIESLGVLVEQTMIFVRRDHHVDKEAWSTYQLSYIASSNHHDCPNPFLSPSLP